MKVTVTAHHLRGYRSTVRTSQRLAEQAARLVARSVPGRMPDVRLVLADGRSMADLVCAAMVEVAGGQVDRWVQACALREMRRTAAATFACAVPMPDGTVLIVVNVDKHPTPAEYATTVVHELVHAMQFSRRGVRERFERQARDGLKVERQSWRQGRAFNRHLSADEDEARGLEHLAGQLTRGTAAA